MTNLKKLVSFVIFGIIGTIGCNKTENSDKIAFSPYNFKGRLDNEIVEFWREGTSPHNYRNYLKVIKPDTTTKIYIDGNNDLLVDAVQIKERQKEETIYTKYILENGLVKEDSLSKQILDIYQKEFDSYLEKIIKYKNNY